MGRADLVQLELLACSLRRRTDVSEFMCSVHEMQAISSWIAGYAVHGVKRAEEQSPATSIPKKESARHVG
eukprot:569292-Rhodomonas_salina.2